MFKKTLLTTALALCVSNPLSAAAFSKLMDDTDDTSNTPLAYELTLQQAAALRAQLPYDTSPSFEEKNAIALLYEQAAKEAHEAEAFDAVKAIIQKLTSLGFTQRASHLGSLASPSGSPTKAGTPSSPIRR